MKSFKSLKIHTRNYCLFGTQIVSEFSEIQQNKSHKCYMKADMSSWFKSFPVLGSISYNNLLAEGENGKRSVKT